LMPRKPLVSAYAISDRAAPVGAVAHTLKQPLAVAWGYLELILDDPSTLDPTTLRYLHEIQLAVQSLDDIVNRLQFRSYPGRLDTPALDDLPAAA
jgi:signal transduction histidine kinase